jgi:hypothetical protein
MREFVRPGWATQTEATMRSIDSAQNLTHLGPVIYLDGVDTETSETRTDEVDVQIIQDIYITNDGELEHHAPVIAVSVEQVHLTADQARALSTALLNAADTIEPAIGLTYSTREGN